MYAQLVPHWHSGAAVLHSAALRLSKGLRGTKLAPVDVVDFVRLDGSGHWNVWRKIWWPLTVIVEDATSFAVGHLSFPEIPAERTLTLAPRTLADKARTRREAAKDFMIGSELGQLDGISRNLYSSRRENRQLVRLTRHVAVWKSWKLAVACS